MSKNSCTSENNYDAALDDQIKEYFRKRGYRIESELTSSGSESVSKSDIVAAVQNGNQIKVFGIQVKRPSNKTTRITYTLDNNQHNIMVSFTDFIAYAFPDCVYLKTKMNTILYHTKFSIPSKISFKKTISNDDISKSFASNWGYLADKVIECTFGKILSSVKELNQIFSDMRTNPVRLFFVDLGLPNHLDHRYK